MLSLVSADDQHILRLAFLYDFDRELLAEQLGIKATTARVRLMGAKSLAHGLVQAAGRRETMCNQMLKRVQAMQRYMRAVEFGDIETVATMLEDAEQDRALESMPFWKCMQAISMKTIRLYRMTTLLKHNNF